MLAGSRAPVTSPPTTKAHWGWQQGAWQAAASVSGANRKKSNAARIKAIDKYIGKLGAVIAKMDKERKALEEEAKTLREKAMATADVAQAEAWAKEASEAEGQEEMIWQKAAEIRGKVVWQVRLRNSLLEREQRRRFEDASEPGN